MGNSRNCARKKSVTRQRVTSITAARNSVLSTGKQQQRWASKLLEWEGQINEMEKQLEPWRHRRGEIRSDDQNLMALENCGALHEVSFGRV